MQMLRRYFIISLLGHLAIFLVFISNLAFLSTLPVLENSNQQDVINAVVLGDTALSKIIAPPQNILAKSTKVAKKAIRTANNDKAAIALSPLKKNKTQPNVNADKTLKKLLGKNLLQDIKSIKVKKQKLKHQQLQNHFKQTLQQQAEETFRQTLLNEDIKLQNAKIRKSQGIVNKYKALILQAISNQWIIPPQVKRNLSLSVMIRLAPGGSVLDVQITKSSGNSALDSSVRAAILKASPLPVPSDFSEFNLFKQFILKVRPENILHNEALT